MNISFKYLALVSALCLSISCSKEDDMGDPNNPDPQTEEFYTEPTSYDVEKNLVVDYGVNNTDEGDDSALLQQAIDEISALPNGGKLFIPAGDYYFLTIKIGSNVHIEIDEGATIYPTFVDDGRNHQVFDIGNGAAGWSRNVSVVGLGEGFTVDFTKTTDVNLAVFAVGNARNFKISNFSIEDNETIFASILINFSENAGVYRWPQRGIVEKVKTYNAHLGYGLIQAYAADDILFEDLYSEGGVTLRLETDNLKMKEAGIGGLRNIVARDIRSENGQNAVMLSPHFQDNGKITIENVHAKNSLVAVRVEEGFVEIFNEDGESKEDLIARVRELIDPNAIEITYLRGAGTRWASRIKNEFAQITFDKTGLKPGIFEGATVSGITAEYGESGHYKVKFIDYLPCSEREKICRKEAGVNWYEGPSVAATFDNNIAGAEFGSYDVELSDITATGFPSESTVSISEITPTISCGGISYPICN